VSIQESMMLLELARLVRILARRVRTLEQRSPGWEPWPADLLERLETFERTTGQPIHGNTVPANPVPELLRRIEALEAAAIAAGNASDTGNEKAQASGNLADFSRRLEVLEQSVGITESNTERSGADVAMPGPAAIAVAIRSETAQEQWMSNGNSDALQTLEARVSALEARHDPVSLHATNAQRIAHGEAHRAAIANVLQTDTGATGPRVIEALRVSHAGKLPSLRTVRWHLAAIRGNGKAAVLPQWQSEMNRDRSDKHD
jgi:hypothetical protein